MRRLTRLDVDPESQDVLDQRTHEIEASEDPGSLSDQLWTGRGVLYDALRSRLAEMSSGRQRCMYCEDSVGTDIDHFYPRRRFPLRTFVWLNHVLACSACNRRKSHTFPLDDRGEPLLIDPTHDDPREHIVYSPTLGQFVGTTPRGDESINVFDLNRGYLVQGRADAWLVLQELVEAYATSRDRGDEARAAEWREVVSRYSFSSVFVEILHAAAHEETQAWLRPECAGAIARYPEIGEWVVG